jgi:IclR family transcriptional regulator, acetate operon repressor
MTQVMQSSLTTLRVLEVVASRQPVAVAEVARLIGRPKSTAQRALVTLEEAGWIRPGGADRTRWTLTARLTELAGRVGNEVGLREAAEPCLTALRDRTDESVSLCVREGDTTVSIAFYEGRQTIRYVAPVGVRLPLHAGGAGKVILAALSKPERDAYSRRKLERFTPATLTSRAALLRDLAEIETRGYGVSRGEVTPGAVGVAAVIRHPSGAPFAGVAVSLPAGRADDRAIADLGEQVREAAAQIERALAGP